MSVIGQIGMATNRSLGKCNTKSTTGRPETEVLMLSSVYVDDIRTVKYNIKMISEFTGRHINSETVKSRNYLAGGRKNSLYFSSVI